MSDDWYRLDADHNPVPDPGHTSRDTYDWIVGKTTIGDAEVSTVFLRLDHAYGSEGPILFETLIFGGAHADEMWRYRTWDEAAEGHKRTVEMLERETRYVP